MQLSSNRGSPSAADRPPIRCNLGSSWGMRAASTTFLVIICSSLICKIRAIWVKSLWSNRKLPLVIRVMVAAGSTSVNSAAENVSSSTVHAKDADRGRLAHGQALVKRSDVVCG